MLTGSRGWSNLLLITTLSNTGINACDSKNATVNITVLVMRLRLGRRLVNLLHLDLAQWTKTFTNGVEVTKTLTLLEPQSRFGDKLLEI